MHEPDDTDRQLKRARSRSDRERRARKEAERLLEAKSRELYDVNVALQQSHDALEERVDERTRELQRANDQLRDEIARRSEVEADLREALVAAEAASRAKLQFLANMSHEIRTPLNGVIGMVELLTLSDLDAEQRGYLSTVRQSADSLLVIINDILDLAKIENQRMELEATPFHVTDTVRGVVELFGGLAREKCVELEAHVASGVPDAVLGDPVRLRQVLSNLVGNAVKFTPSGGRIDLGLVCTGTDGDLATLVFEVRDTGLGIADEKLATIFDSFTQADESTTRQFGGTGLGLAICRQLVELMDGTISVTSALDTGSTFRVEVRLPLTDEVPLEQGGVQLHGVWNTDDPVLLVEDNPVNQCVATRMLERMGLTVDVAANGEEALSALGRQPYALVLMDCQMPVLDGYAATRALRDGQAPVLDQDVPVIAMTAHAMAGDEARCRAAGMDDYLAKPITFDSLRETLARWLGDLEPTRSP